MTQDFRSAAPPAAEPLQDAPPSVVWSDAQLLLLALQVDPVGLGGVWLRAGHGPVREAWLAQLVRAMGQRPLVKVPHHIDTERLLGGTDLTHTLQTGKLQWHEGVLAQAHGGIATLAMAERLSPATAAQMLYTLDRGRIRQQNGETDCRFGIVALDESGEDEPGLAPALADRLGVWLSLDTVSRCDSLNTLELLSADELARTQSELHKVQAQDQDVGALCQAALALGIDSLRAPLLALQVARVHAALHQRDTLAQEDLALAARWVLAPRATMVPQPVQEPPPEESDSQPPPEEPPPDQAEQDDSPAPPPQEQGESEMAKIPTEQDLAEMLLAAAAAALPPHLLDRLLLQRQSPQKGVRAAHSGSSGQAQKHTMRGRPLSPRAGKPHAGARLHLLATLRAAAPKQTLRRKPQGMQNPARNRISLWPEDFHIQRFEQRSPSCLIFAIDASGSAALERLAEAKGAVEILLQQSYARRDSVCVLAFRGAKAEVLLPPTRSLVRAKRALAGLPGGGGTPLAMALQLGLEQAMQVQRAGMTPSLVVLSDGRANIDLAGMGGRAQAGADALALAQRWALSPWAALWIDTAPKPEPLAQALARSMGAQYLPMPHVQAQRMAAAMQTLRGV
jgi:magnesium chelatase subunit D